MPEPLTLYLAAPRGFCAGVDRAIKIVEMALEKWGAPVYVRHEIVHNRFVVDGLKAKGAVFVEELADCPPDRPVVFSAHGVPKSVPAEAEARNISTSTPPARWSPRSTSRPSATHENGLQMVMIGHAGHPEVDRHHGPAPAGRGDAGRDRRRRRDDRPARPRPARLHHPDDALGRRHRRGRRGAARALSRRSSGRAREDICYATTNRQEAVKAMAPKIDALLVIGAPNSSNSQRLVEVGRRAGCGYAQLVQRAADIDWRALDGARAVGITAGASAPEVLVEEVVAAFRARYDVTERAGRDRDARASSSRCRASSGPRSHEPHPAARARSSAPRVCCPSSTPCCWSSPSPGTWPTLGLFPSDRAGGVLILERFGAAILGFMGGCLWGFASAPGRGPTALLPRRLGGAGDPRRARDPAEPGALLPLARLRLRRAAGDRPPLHPRRGRAAWWLSLRLPLTAGVIACLLVGALYG